eukprot:Rmarinus@m.16774
MNIRLAVELFFNKSESYFRKQRNVLPTIGRILVALSFVEDSWRLLTNWPAVVKNMSYMSVFAPAMLTGLIGAQCLGSLLVCLKVHEIFASRALIGCCIFQIFGMVVSNGVMATGFTFWLLSKLAIIAGLWLITFADGLSEEKGSILGVTLSQVSSRHEKVATLVTRLLLSALCVYKIWQEVIETFFREAGDAGVLSPLALCFGVLGTLVGALLAIGYKTRMSCVILMFIIVACTFIVNDFWMIKRNESQYYVRRSHFFEDLSITGGLLLVTAIGPGGFSLDKRLQKGY